MTTTQDKIAAAIVEHVAGVNPMIGHNLPADPLIALRENLADKALTLTKRRDELLAAVGRMPAVIDADTIKGAADMVKLLAALHKNAEAMRVAEKEPHLASGRAVDAYFKDITDPVEAAKRAVESKMTIHQRKVAEEERRIREAAERAAREESERASREATARAAAMKNQADLDAAVSAEAIAAQARADAEQARKAAAVKPAELSRTRGDFGAVASLRTWWDFRNLDCDKIDLAKLRPYLATADIEKSLRGFIKAGGREIDGAEIFENTATRVS